MNPAEVAASQSLRCNVSSFLVRLSFSIVGRTPPHLEKHRRVLHDATRHAHLLFWPAEVAGTQRMPHRVMVRAEGKPAHGAEDAP